MEEERKDSGKVHVFSGERTWRTAENGKEQTPRQRRAAEIKQQRKVEAEWAVDGQPRQRRAAEIKQQTQVEDGKSVNGQFRQRKAVEGKQQTGQMKQTVALQTVSENSRRDSTRTVRGGRASRYTGTTWAVSENKKATKRRREQENEMKMQSLKITLGILVVILIAAIIYEVVLGHGTKMTGSERMAQQKQQELMQQSEEDISEADSRAVSEAEDSQTAEDEGSQTAKDGSGTDQKMETEANDIETK